MWLRIWEDFFKTLKPGGNMAQLMKMREPLKLQLTGELKMQQMRSFWNNLDNLD